jgi:hypothetical protein
MSTGPPGRSMHTSREPTSTSSTREVVGSVASHHRFIACVGRRATGIPGTRCRCVGVRPVELKPVRRAPGEHSSDMCAPLADVPRGHVEVRRFRESCANPSIARRTRKSCLRSTMPTAALASRRVSRPTGRSASLCAGCMADAAGGAETRLRERAGRSRRAARALAGPRHPRLGGLQEERIEVLRERQRGSRPAAFRLLETLLFRIVGRDQKRCYGSTRAGRASRAVGPRVRRRIASRPWAVIWLLAIGMIASTCVGGAEADNLAWWRITLVGRAQCDRGRTGSLTLVLGRPW